MIVSGLEALAAGGLAVAGHMVSSTALVRSRPDRAPVLLHVASAVGLVIILALADVVFAEGDARPFWIAVSVLYGGAVGFLFLFAAVHKSISLEVLAALAAAPQQHLPIELIARQFVLPRFVERIELLIAGGLAQRAKDGYSITERGARAARKLGRVQRLAGITRSGLYGRAS